MTLIEGDGIGPEISNAVQDIFAAAKVLIDSIFSVGYGIPDIYIIFIYRYI